MTLIGTLPAESGGSLCLSMAAALVMHYCGLSEEASWNYILDLAVDYPAAWIRLAVIEALYQGRYKPVSVSQILAIWQRRNKPLCHFGREFESIITVPLQHLPRTPSQLYFQAPADRLPRRTLTSTLKSLWATRLDQPVPSSPVPPFNPISPINPTPAPPDRPQSTPQPLSLSQSAPSASPIAAPPAPQPQPENSREIAPTSISTGDELGQDAVAATGFLEVADSHPLANTGEGTETLVAPGGTQAVTSASLPAIGPNPGIEAATDRKPNAKPDVSPEITPDLPPNPVSGITPGTALGTTSGITPETTPENTLEITQTGEVSAQAAPDRPNPVPTPANAVVLTLEPPIEATDPGTVALDPPNAETPAPASALQPAMEVDSPDRPLVSPAATIAEAHPTSLVGTTLLYPPPARRTTTPPLPIHRFSPLQDSTGFAQKLRALAFTSH
ncbi:MAG: hypothetical protein ACO331_06525 [Prochlorothrix sp.]